MFKAIKNFLQKTFLLQTFISNKFVLSITYGLFIFSFLTLFQPFQLDLLKDNLVGYVLIISVIYAVIPLIFFLVLEKINYQKCSIGYLIILYLFFILILSTVTWYTSGVYKDLIHYSKKLSFFRFFEYTLFVSFFTAPLIFIYNDKITKYKSTNATKVGRTITIYSENKKEELNINIDKLIYISIVGNYASFFIITEKEIKELILRNTLSNILNQIEEHPTIFRCHKSYIINSLCVNSISGNARGYFLKLNKIANKIPVSRSFNKKDLEKLLQ